MVSHTVAQFAHDHGEEQNNLSLSQLYCHSQGHKNGWSSGSDLADARL